MKSYKMLKKWRKGGKTKMNENGNKQKVVINMVNVNPTLSIITLNADPKCIN